MVDVFLVVVVAYFTIRELLTTRPWLKGFLKKQLVSCKRSVNHPYSGSIFVIA